MAKQIQPPVHLEFTVRQIQDGKEVKELFMVMAGRVDVSVPDPIVGEMSREQARRFGESLLTALDETES